MISLGRRVSDEDLRGEEINSAPQEWCSPTQASSSDSLSSNWMVSMSRWSAVVGFWPIRAWNGAMKMRNAYEPFEVPPVFDRKRTDARLATAQVLGGPAGERAGLGARDIAERNGAGPPREGNQEVTRIASNSRRNKAAPAHKPPVKGRDGHHGERWYGPAKVYAPAFDPVLLPSIG